MPSFEIGFSCRSISISINFSDFDFDVRAIDSNIVSAYALTCGRTEHLAGCDIKNGTVPGTSDFNTFDFPLTKRPAHVCACVIDRVKRTAHVEKGDLFTVDLDHRGLACRNVIGPGNFYSLGHCISHRLGLIARSLSTARVGRQAPNLVPLLPSKLSQKPSHRIVEVINHSLFQRNDGVVGDVNVFRTDLRAAFGYVAKSNAKFIFKQFGARQSIERMHFQSGDAHEETRAAELLFLLMIAQYVADILAKKALNAFAKLLDAIDFALIHFPFDVGPRREWRDLLIDAVIPRDVGNQILQHRE